MYFSTSLESLPQCHEFFATDESEPKVQTAEYKDDLEFTFEIPEA